MLRSVAKNKQANKAKQPFNSRLDIAEKRVNELEGGLQNNIKNEAQRYLKNGKHRRNSKKHRSEKDVKSM